MGESPYGSVAQLVERTTENREVTGSTPVGATINQPVVTRKLRLIAAEARPGMRSTAFTVAPADAAADAPGSEVLAAAI